MDTTNINQKLDQLLLKLTPEEISFAEIYLETGSQITAYERAKGVKRSTASGNASNYLKARPDLQEAINLMQEQQFSAEVLTNEQRYAALNTLFIKESRKQNGSDKATKLSKEMRDLENHILDTKKQLAEIEAIKTPKKSKGSEGMSVIEWKECYFKIHRMMGLLDCYNNDFCFGHKKPDSDLMQLFYTAENFKNQYDEWLSKQPKETD